MNGSGNLRYAKQSLIGKEYLNTKELTFIIRNRMKTLLCNI